MARTTKLTVAVTGPTGTFGFGLVPLLEADKRVAKVVGVARRPFDPATHGWSKMTYRQGDVRDPTALTEAFAGADVVVHLAFIITGTSASDQIREINVDGTVNAFRAAAAAGAGRFVYASSVAAYGFHRDNPVGMTEEWPTRAADHLFYAQEKAELEELLATEALAHPKLGLYLLRPPIVLGPHAIGGKSELAERLLPAGLRAAALGRRLPVHLPVPAPALPMQFIHEDDVGLAFRQCIVGAGPPGAYNICGGRRGHRRRRGPGAGPDAGAGAVAPGPGRGPGGGGPAAPLVRPARRRLGRGPQPPVDHGRLQGQGRPRLAPRLHQHPGPPRHPRARGLTPIPTELVRKVAASEPESAHVPDHR